MIDLHCHLLPGIDDGPATIDGSLALARLQVEKGITTVVATPHADWSFDNRTDEVNAGVEEVRAALAEEGIPLQVLTGAEIAVTKAAELPDSELAGLALARGEWLLLEAPLAPAAVGFEGMVQQVQARGYKVLLAHPERSPVIQRDPEVLEKLVRGGVLGQVTAGSLRGQFGEPVRAFTLDLISRGLVHNVASDAHDARRRRPGLSAPISENGLGQFEDYWCREVPTAIVGGRAIPKPPGPFPEPPSAGGRLRRLFGR